jgi:hypothetical protein
MGRVENIGLQEAIQAVRAELTSAMAAGTGEQIRFRVRSVELEFQVAVERSTEGSGKVRFWVVDLTAGGKLGSVSTHTVRVGLDPVDAAGGDVEVADEERLKPG